MQGAVRGTRAGSRYTHRVAISNHRLVAADDDAIAFRWKDYRLSGPDHWKTIPLHAHEFVRRFLLHVLPKASTASATTGSFAESIATRCAAAEVLLGHAAPIRCLRVCVKYKQTSAKTD